MFVLCELGFVVLVTLCVTSEEKAPRSIDGSNRMAVSPHRGLKVSALESRAANLCKL